MSSKEKRKKVGYLVYDDKERPLAYLDTMAQVARFTGLSREGLCKAMKNTDLYRNSRIAKGRKNHIIFREVYYA